MIIVSCETILKGCVIMNEIEKVKMFLTELTTLTDKYNIVICGCGCCGSPWLNVINGCNYDNLLYYDNSYRVDNNDYSNDEYYITGGEKTNEIN